MRAGFKKKKKERKGASHGKIRWWGEAEGIPSRGTQERRCYDRVELVESKVGEAEVGQTNAGVDHWVGMTERKTSSLALQATVGTLDLILKGL